MFIKYIKVSNFLSLSEVDTHSCNASDWGCTVFQESVIVVASTHAVYKTTLDVDTTMFERRQSTY